MKDQVDALPDATADWPLVPISDIANHCLGKMLDKHKNKGTPKPYLRNLNVRWFDFDTSDVLEMRFEDHEAERYQACKGDLIICEGGYPGRAAIWHDEEPIYIQKALHRVRFHEPERAQWVLYWLYFNDLNGRLSEAFSGTGIQHFTKSALARFEVPLPPLEEQKRIVAKLDQAFAALDRARAHAEANLADAEELFDAKLNEVFGQPQGDWCEGKLGDICSKIGSGATPRGGAEAYKSEGISLIRSLNVYDRDFRRAKLAFIDDEQAAKLSNVIVEESDVLFNITGASIARCCMVDEAVLPARVNQHVAILRPDRERLLPAFLTLFMTASDQKKRLLQTGSEGGATRQAITKSQLQSLSVRFPADIRAQQDVVEKLQLFEIRCREVAASYRRKLDDIADLRQSLLQKAFSGQLT